MNRSSRAVAALVAAVACAAVAGAQTLVATDDAYSVPFGTPLLVEPPGVLDNDTYGGNPAADEGATAELLSYPSYGTIDCESDPTTYDLCPDGSFSYTPGAGFPGFDSFTYQAVRGADTDPATVTLTACSGGPAPVVCWAEAAYLGKLGELGYETFSEGFEDDVAWGSARYTETAPSVVSQGITWQTNHYYDPAWNEITTDTAQARTGAYGVFDPAHGYATGSSAECDVDVPPPQCLYKDGFTGTSSSTLVGVGGFFTGIAQPNLVMILDGGTPTGLGLVGTGVEQFFGVIDTVGFTTFRVEETDGKVGQQRFVFGDDFTFGTTGSDTTPPQVTLVDTVAGTVDGELSQGEVTDAAISQFLVTYSEPVSDLGADAGQHSVTNPANYLLFSDGGDGFDTTSCAAGVDAGDVEVSVDSVGYVTGSELTATVDVNGGFALPVASYRLLVCGTTSIKDWAGNTLDGDGNGTGGDDFVRDFDVVDNPTVAVVAALGAHERAGAVVVEWRTVSEPGTVGFDLWRLDPGTGRYRRLNETLLPALIGSSTGGDYRFVDEDASPHDRHSYLLVERSSDGAQRPHGPYQVEVDWALRNDAPITGFDRRPSPMSADLAARLAASRAERQAWSAQRTAAPAKTRRGPARRAPLGAVKIAVSEPGLYLVSASEIAAALQIETAGVERRIHDRGVALRNQGRTVAWRPAAGDHGLLFYGEPSSSPFTRQNVYRLEWFHGPVMADADGGSPAPVAGPLSFRDALHFEHDLLPATAASVDPEEDFWYWDLLVAGDLELESRQFTLPVPSPATSPEEATLTLHLRGILSTGRADEHHIAVRLNDVEIGEAWFEGADLGQIQLPFAQDLLQEGDNTVEVTALLDGDAPSSFLFLDSFDLAYRRHYRADTGAVRWRGGDNPVVTVAGFEGAGVAVLELSDPLAPRWLTGLTVDTGADGVRVSLEPAAPDAPYLAVSEASITAPERVWADNRSSLGRRGRTADYLVITSGELAAAARTLADYRQGTGLETLVVEVEDIYDEFNDGLASPYAIRDFLAYAHSEWLRPPRYAVLAGAGSFDYRDCLGHGGNLVPPLLVATRDGLYASDTLLGDVDRDGVPEIAVGRLPVLTAVELERLAARISSYEAAPAADWQRRIVMAADDPDRAGDFPADSDRVASLLGEGWTIDRVYLSELAPEQARQTLIDRLRDGAGWLNYLGHAGVEQLAHEGLLLIEDVAALTNRDRLPVVAGWTCQIGRFELPDAVSVGEALLLADDGGAVAVWGPAGLSVNGDAAMLNEALFGAIFGAGERILGDALLDSLAEYAATGGELDTVASYSLLGDPATGLRLP